MSPPVCPLCECADQPSICVVCINYKLAEKQARLQMLSLTRTQLRQKLDASLLQRREMEEQRMWQTEAEDRRQQLERRLRMERATADRESSALETRRREVSETANQDAAAMRQAATLQEEAMEHDRKMMFLSRTQMGRLLEEVAISRRVVLKRLTIIFPLRPAMAESGAGEGDAHQALSSQRVRICGVRLPDGEDLLSVPPLELSAALGYFVHFLALTAKYCSTPLLHTAGFAASSSTIWQRASYWKAAPAHGKHPYALYLRRPGTASPDDPPHTNHTPAAPHTAIPPPPSHNPAAPHGPPQSASEGTPSGATPTPTAGSEGQLKRGIALLRRSASCITAFQEASGRWGGTGADPREDPRGAAVLQSVSPFAAFAVMVANLTRDPRAPPAGLLRRSTRYAPAGPHLLASGASTSIGSPSIAAEYGYQESTEDMSKESMTSGRHREEDRVFEGWDLVERQPLPPPPSRAEDVEHWTRAMFVDANR